MELRRTIRWTMIGLMLAIFLTLLCQVKPVFADSFINVADFGADGTDMESDRNALQEALLKATEYDGMTEVYVPDGTYYIDDFVGIYSNTWLHLSDNAIIKRMDGCYQNVVLTGVHGNGNDGICYWDCPHYGYDQVENVIISGGEWDGNLDAGEYAFPNGEDLSQCILSFHHATNITICETKFGNTDAKHFINFDGVDGITIYDCEFYNQWRNENFSYSVEDWNGAEAIHTDYIFPNGWSKAYPIEDLACRNIVIENCTFENCISGIGTHNFTMGLYMEGFTVRDCSFNQMQGHCINALGCIDAVISGNTANGVSQFVQMHRNQNGLIEGNEMTCCPYYKEETAIDLCHGTECTVRNNLIRTAATHAVYCANLDDDSSGDCSVIITQNEIDAPGSSGIFIRDGVYATVTDNAVFESGSVADAGISLYLNEQEVTICNNEVDGFVYGIKVSKCAGNDNIEQNTVSSAIEQGISVYQSNSVQLKGGNVCNSKIGLRADGSDVKVNSLVLNDNEKAQESINGGYIDVADSEKRIRNNTDTKVTKNTVPEKKQTNEESVSNKKEVKSIPVYRLFNPRTGEHFYTVSKFEYEHVIKVLGWNGEGIGWYAPSTSKSPVYRLYNPNAGEHFYTKSIYERDWLGSLGWRMEGIGWYSDDEQRCPVYRHYHPIQRTGNHHYTTSKGESDYIVKHEGWRYEGIAWYAVSNP